MPLESLLAAVGAMADMEPQQDNDGGDLVAWVHRKNKPSTKGRRALRATLVVHYVS